MAHLKSLVLDHTGMGSTVIVASRGRHDVCEQLGHIMEETAYGFVGRFHTVHVNLARLYLYLLAYLFQHELYHLDFVPQREVFFLQVRQRRQEGDKGGKPL